MYNVLLNSTINNSERCHYWNYDWTLISINFIIGFQRSFTDPFVQLEFEYGGHNEFYDQLGQQLERQRWLGKGSSKQLTGHSIGITGIQRNIQNRLDQQDQQINASFKDLSVLMNQAKEMVSLSNAITAKLAKEANKSGENEDDEDMSKLRGYFSSMGIIDSPVTKEGSGSKYFKDLAMEISRNMTGNTKCSLAILVKN